MSSSEVSPVQGSWTGTGGRKGAPWELRESTDRYELYTLGVTTPFVGREAIALSVTRRWLFLHSVEVRREGERRRYTGISRSNAADLRRALHRFMVRAAVLEELTQVKTWQALVSDGVNRSITDGCWIPEEAIVDLESRRPAADPANWFNFSSGAELAAALTPEEHASVEFFVGDFRAWIGACNEQILQKELVDQRDFFNRIETSPLTDEQARAVICFDNRVNVVASAGSGKTSVMVARAAYAIHRGFVRPERVLLLAFNKAAATELQERVAKRLAALGLPSTGLKASTFHSFGLGVIGDATGRKPRLASWLDGGQDVGMIMRIVDELRDESIEFRFKWDIFRLLYARVGDEPDEGEHDAWDKAERRTGLQTFKGDVVKSQGERLIADWLYLNGVDYLYETPYSIDVATPEHSQYRPDFYYPSVDVWHEHWAIGHDGKPPKSFVGYGEGMRWKRELHAANGTTLVETKWVDIIDTSGFPALEAELEGLGLSMDWNPDRPMPGAKPVDNKELARLVRTFMSHVKSNSLTPDALENRIATAPKRLQSYRSRMFVDLYWRIHEKWEDRLASDGSVDFEDMLVRAAEHVEHGETKPGFDLVLVDEFQDASQARARLVAALVKPKGKYLLAVGDDWQAINRFAGADISVMTDFEKWFGRGHVLQLQTTFRCTQEICDVSSAFVSKNPRQLRKQVRSAQTEQGEHVLVLTVDSKESVPLIIEEWLDELADAVSSGGVVADREDVVTVNILGRYNFDRDLVPKWKGDGIDVTFRTIHGAKGLEADYVIVPNLGRGKYGFPSQIADDPVLELAMSQAEEFPHSEERRLLYVAMTRARRQVVLVGVAGSESPFLVELIDDGLVSTLSDGTSATVVCPKCREGTLVLRSGPYGEFYGCTSFPKCRNSQKSLT